MKVLRPGREGSPLWYIGCVLSLVFLCAWEYFTIAMGAPWFFPLFGGVLLCREALELAGALLARRRAKGAEEARDEAEPLARASARACRWRDAANGAFVPARVDLFDDLHRPDRADLAAHLALSRRRPCHAGFFIATGGALRGGGGEPPRARSLRAMMPGLLLALLGLMLAALCLTLAVPAGAPWAVCLVPFAVAAVGVAAAIVNARKASKNDTADGAPRTCPRCEATVPAGESVCPRCGKRVRAGKTRETDAGT